MRSLVEQGKTIVIITHKLREIKAAADRCTIIRRGKVVDTVDVAATSEQELASKMVGRDVSLVVDKKPANPGDVSLKLEKLNVNDSRGVPALIALTTGVRDE